MLFKQLIISEVFLQKLLLVVIWLENLLLCSKINFAKNAIQIGHFDGSAVFAVSPFGQRSTMLVSTAIQMPEESSLQIYLQLFLCS